MCQVVNILDLADKAARCAMRGHGTVEDWEDATQEAAVAIWAACDKPEGVAFLAGKHAVYDWLRSWLRHPRGGTILDYLDYAREEHHPPRLEYLNEIAPLLQAQGSMKADEEIRYLELRLRGYSTDGIALEMKLSRRNVYAIRERLMPRLERLSRGVIPPTRGDAIRAGRARKAT